MTFIDPWTVEIELEDDDDGGWPSVQDVRELLDDYQREITALMLRYSDLSEAEALEKQEWLWAWVKTFKMAYEYISLSMEVPYYWAMCCIFRGVNHEWYLDRRYWPEPKNKKHE
jgi:hypothetical protein